MEKFTIVTQGSATYLERTLGADELLDEVDRGMLVSNQISGMLPLNIQWINADCRLLYNITGLTPPVQAASGADGKSDAPGLCKGAAV